MSQVSVAGSQESLWLPGASQTRAKSHWSLSAQPQPFMGLFTLIKAVIEGTSQDGEYRCTPITHRVSSISPCQLPHKPQFSSVCPAALALLRFLGICVERDLSGQKGSVRAKFTHKSYWWLLRGLVQQVVSMAGRYWGTNMNANEVSQGSVVVLINMLTEWAQTFKRSVIIIICLKVMLSICHLRSYCPLRWKCFSWPNKKWAIKLEQFPLRGQVWSGRPRLVKTVWHLSGSTPLNSWIQYRSNIKTKLSPVRASQITTQTKVVPDWSTNQHSKESSQPLYSAYIMQSVTLWCNKVTGVNVKLVRGLFRHFRISRGRGFFNIADLLRAQNPPH